MRDEVRNNGSCRLDFAARNELAFQRDAHWCWLDAPETDAYAVFRKNFDYAAEDGKCVLLISVDSSFAVWINGKRCPGGQYSDYPQQRSYSALDIAKYLHAGQNLLEIEVHYTGRKFNNYLPGKPGIRAAVTSERGVLCATDESWKCALSNHYVSGSARIIMPPLGFIFEYDARKTPENWSIPRLYTDQEYAPTLESRPVAQLIELPEPPTALQASGLLFRPHEYPDDPGACCEGDYLRAQSPDQSFVISERFRKNPYLLRFETEGEFMEMRSLPEGECANGRFVIVDLGKETVGLFKMRLRASAGTVIDIAYGEHLDRGRVQTHREGEYNLADRYICREGEQEFIYPHRRFGCRYIQLNITRFGNTPFAISYIGLIPQMLPLPPEAAFSCEDGEVMRIRDICKRTMELCLHEHYEDCPWREQAMWNLDARIQMFIGYHLWGNYDYAAAGLELMRRSFHDGFLASTQPGSSEKKVIPMFTLTYIAAVWERLLFGGNWEALPHHLQCVDAILDHVLARKKEGLFFLEEDLQRFWFFYEWQEELAFVNRFPQSLWNLFVLEALQAAAGLHRFSGNSKRAEKLSAEVRSLRFAIEKSFREKDCYGVYLPGQNQHHYELVQFLMLAYGKLSVERRERVWSALASGRLLPVTTSSLLFMLQGLMECTPESRLYCDCKMIEMYRPMLDAGASTVWEVPEGSHDPGGLRSLCHAWSAIPIAYGHRYLLGVCPLEAGFKRFSVRIYPGHLTHASGEIPTPHGKIRISWSRERAGLKISVVCPENCIPVKEEYSEYPVIDWKITTVGCNQTQ